MDLAKRVQNSKLPIKQLRVIEAILDDLESNSFLTGHEICEKFDISFSSLTRMSKALSYSGFPELKKEIEQLYKTESSPTLKAQSFINSSEKESILSIVYQSEMRAISKFIKGISEDELSSAAKKINQAQRVFIIGIGQLGPIATKLSEGLRLLSKETILLTDLGFSKLVEIHSPSSKDVVIALSINKELVELQDFLKQARRENIFSLLFTDKKVGRLQKQASSTIHTPSTGSGMINCLTSYLMGTNILESYIFSLDKHVHLSKVKKIEKKWNSLPLFLN